MSGNKEYQDDFAGHEYVVPADQEPSITSDHDKMLGALEAMFYNGYEVLLGSMEEDSRVNPARYTVLEKPLFEGVTLLLAHLNEVYPDERITKMIEEAREIHDRARQF